MAHAAAGPAPRRVATHGRVGLGEGDVARYSVARVWATAVSGFLRCCRSHAFLIGSPSHYNHRVEWIRLPLDDLVSRLHQLTMDDLSASIQGLPSKDRPSINRHSYHNTCIGLVWHIVFRVHYLECAGATNVCDLITLLSQR